MERVIFSPGSVKQTFFNQCFQVTTFSNISINIMLIFAFIHRVFPPSPAYLGSRWSSGSLQCWQWSRHRRWPRRRRRGARRRGFFWERHGAPATPSVRGGGGGAAEEVFNRDGGAEQTPHEWDQPLQIWPPAAHVRAVLKLAVFAGRRAARRQSRPRLTGRGGAHQHGRSSPGRGAQSGEASDRGTEREG